ncbi:hypothetical protein AB6A40_005282 [Gnathostoma spinigerum]|uniref:Uncharacterized protein n=1 Tax=Gnathostoma spinigerum TaxID=75299 RepID=A0ABD6EF50_9BILA
MYVYINIIHFPLRLLPFQIQKVFLHESSLYKEKLKLDKLHALWPPNVSFAICLAHISIVYSLYRFCLTPQNLLSSWIRLKRDLRKIVKDFWEREASTLNDRYERKNAETIRPVQKEICSTKQSKMEEAAAKQLENDEQQRELELDGYRDGRRCWKIAETDFTQCIKEGAKISEREVLMRTTKESKCGIRCRFVSELTNVNVGFLTFIAFSLSISVTLCTMHIRMMSDMNHVVIFLFWMHNLLIYLLVMFITFEKDQSECLKMKED